MFDREVARRGQAALPDLRMWLEPLPRLRVWSATRPATISLEFTRHLLPNMHSSFCIFADCDYSLQTMKITLVLLALILACACGQTPQANSTPTNRPAPVSPTPVSSAIPNDGDYPAKGVVTKINLEAGSIELDHEEIPGLMPAMRMEFFVTDKKMLDGLSVGTKVDFTLRYKHPTETIVSIKKAK